MTPAPPGRTRSYLNVALGLDQSPVALAMQVEEAYLLARWLILMAGSAQSSTMTAPRLEAAEGSTRLQPPALLCLRMSL